MLNILILGGTQMLGRDLVEKILLQNKYKIFLANRGITNPNLFTNINWIKIDRNNNDSCGALKDNNYDIIVDFSCYTVDQFKNTYQNLNYKKYIYVSTMSVYETNIISNPNLNNDYDKYCVNKFLIEQFIFNENIKNCLIVRPCAVYGDNDYTNRFYKKDNKYYWKVNNLEVGQGTIFVKDFTKKLLYHLNTLPGNGVINICN